LDSSISRPLYQGQPIKQGTSEVFRTEEPKTCVLVVNTVHGTLLCLMAATNADRVAGEQWTTDEHLEDVFTRRANGSLLSLEDFISGQDDDLTNHESQIDYLHAAAAEKHYTPQELADQWSLSATKIRRMFESEPDVLRIGDPSRREGRQLKRGYYTMRISATAAERMYKRLTKV
jgi:hypothetical protein